MDKYRIDRNLYHELKAFCLQYDSKRAALREMIKVASPSITNEPRGSSTNDPVSKTVIRRERYKRDIEMIEKCARTVEAGRWETALIANCCRRVSYERIPIEDLASSNRYSFFLARRKFFYLLAREKYSDFD